MLTRPTHNKSKTQTISAVEANTAIEYTVERCEIWQHSQPLIAISLVWFFECFNDYVHIYIQTLTHKSDRQERIQFLNFLLVSF